MPKIKFDSDVRTRFGGTGISFSAGVHEVDDETLEFLERDMPGSFEVLSGKAAQAPTADKMMDASDLEDKSYRELQEISKELDLPANVSTEEMVENIAKARSS